MFPFRERLVGVLRGMAVRLNPTLLNLIRLVLSKWEFGDVLSSGRDVWGCGTEGKEAQTEMLEGKEGHANGPILPNARQVLLSMATSSQGIATGVAQASHRRQLLRHGV